MTGSRTASLALTVDGQPLPDDVAVLLESATVDDHVLHPDGFRVVFRDPDRDVLARCGAQIGSAVTLAVVTRASPRGDLLCSGEVTALEAELDATGARTVVRGFDHAHRLSRGRTTQTYRQMSVADVVAAVARRAGLRTGRLEQAGPVHEHLAQVNETDWAFLSALAADAGLDLAVDEGRLELLTPVTADEGPAAGDLGSAEPLQLVQGVNLLRVRTTVTSAAQVEQVVVRGWDTTTKSAITATADAVTTTAGIGVRPDELARRFSASPHVVVGAGHADQEQADRSALAVADRVAGTCAQLEAVACGDTQLRAGRPVSLSLLGAPFDGRYTPTSTQHRFDPVEGYTTRLVVSGRQDGSLLALAAAGAARTSGAPSTPLAVGLVTAVDDPEALGRVKLSLPWLSESYETDWTRVVQPGAGAGRGAVVLPEVDDEVLVGFEHADVRRPVVLGGLYNGVDRPPLGEDLVDRSDGSVRRRGFVSRRGHCLVFLDDADDADGVALLTGDRQLRLSLNATDGTVRISSPGDIELSAEGDVRISSGGDTTLAARGRLRGEGATTELSGQPIRLN